MMKSDTINQIKIAVIVSIILMVMTYATQIPLKINNIENTVNKINEDIIIKIHIFSLIVNM
jgi:hypothetical protein